MINDQLLSYIRQQLSHNIPKEIIANNLKSQGWTDADVSEAFSAIAPSIPATPVVPANLAPTPAPVSATPMSSGVVPNINPTQTPMTQSAVNFSNSQPHKSKKALLFSSILLLLIIAGGGAYAYYSGFLNFNKSETFYEVVTEAMKKIDSERYIKNTNEVNVTLKDTKMITALNFPSGTYPEMHFSYNAIVSKEDLNDPLKNKVSMNAKFDIANVLEKTISAEVDFLVPEPMIFYLKLTELTGLPDGAPSLSASLFQGKWWKIDINTLVENFAGIGAEEIQASFKDNQPSKEELEKVEIIFKKYLGTAQAEKLADGTIDGDSAYHWRVNFEKKQIAEMFTEILEVTGKDSSEEIETLGVKEAIESGLNLIDIKPIEILVKKVGYLPIQAKFAFGILDEDGVNIADIDISYTITSSGSIKIEAPAESTDILYLIGPIVQSSLDSARQKGKDAAIKANMSNVRVLGELFWDKNKSNSYSGFCLSKELKDTRKSIEDYGSTAFVCKDSVKAYAVSTKLVTVNYWCVDSTGVSGETTISSGSNTVCPKIIQKSSPDNVFLPVVPSL